ncbi:MAG: DUF1127 domain-containing protein [Sulfitobacter sp.]
MTTLTHRSCAATPIATTHSRSIRTVFAHAYALWCSRRALARLTAAQLEDVGVSASEADHEARRPVWDVPANWRD